MRENDKRIEEKCVQQNKERAQKEERDKYRHFLIFQSSIVEHVQEIFAKT